MVFGLGAPWTDTTPGSVSKLNRVTVISGPGTDLAGLTKSLHVLYKCTETGSGLTIDHVYQTSTDGTSLIDLSSIDSHTHSSTAQGGGLIDIYRANSKVIDLNLCKTDDLKKAQWIQTVSGGGTIEDDIDGTSGEHSIKLRTNGASGDAATVTYPTLRLDFSKRSMYQVKLRIQTASSLALHTGVHADLITSVDSNLVKYNAEVCTATNNNWFLRTASGSNKTTSDTGTAMSTATVALRIEHLPDLGTPETDLYIGAAAVFQKTSDIPISGTTSEANIIRHSIKNSIAADRPLFCYPSRLVYSVSDVWI